VNRGLTVYPVEGSSLLWISEGYFCIMFSRKIGLRDLWLSWQCTWACVCGVVVLFAGPCIDLLRTTWCHDSPLETMYHAIFYLFSLKFFTSLYLLETLLLTFLNWKDSD
jgi:hypothetical protein